MNQPPGQPPGGSPPDGYGGQGRPGGTLVGEPLGEYVAGAPPPVAQQPDAPAQPAQPRGAVPATMVDGQFGPPPAGFPAPPQMAVQPPAHYAPHQAVAAAPMMGAPMMAPSPLGAPYGVAPAPYARKQKSNAGLIAGVLAGGGLVIVAVLAVAVFLVRSRSDEPVDSSQLIELPPVTTVAPIDTPAPYETAAPPEIPTATAEAPPVKTTPTATAKPPATTKPPPTATTTSKPPPTATATATTTSKPPPTATATATTTTPTPTTTSTTPTKPPGGRPPAIRKK